MFMVDNAIFKEKVIESFAEEIHYAKNIDNPDNKIKLQTLTALCERWDITQEVNEFMKTYFPSPGIIGEKSF